MAGFQGGSSAAALQNPGNKARMYMKTKDRELESRIRKARERRCE